MNEFRTILCATDFSEPSLAAVAAARSLALRLGASLTLVTVVERVPLLGAGPVGTQVATMNIEAYQNQLRDQAERQMQELATQQQTPELALQTAVLEGRPSDTIVRHAADEGFDLVVIATHGHAGWRRFLFGSTAEKVVRSAACPVLTVNPGEEAEGD